VEIIVSHVEFMLVYQTNATMYCRFDGPLVVDKMGKPRRYRHTCNYFVCTCTKMITRTPSTASMHIGLRTKL